MPNIYLYSGEAIPSNIKLSDPTVQRSGGATFSITVAQTMPAPSQTATAQTVMPVVVAQTMPLPVQVITAEAKIIFPVTVNQVMPAPMQVITAETSGAVKPKGAGGPRGAWEYYPPIYTIRTKGGQTAPPPGQHTHAIATRRPEPAPIVQRPHPRKPRFVTYGRQSALMPSQGCRMKSHRAVRSRDREESDILALLASL